MSPLLIEILLHYYRRVDDFRDGDFTAPTVRDGIDYLVTEKLLTPSTRRKYDLGDRGKIYVYALMNVPLPVATWLVPGTKSRVLHEAALDTQLLGDAGDVK